MRGWVPEGKWFVRGGRREFRVVNEAGLEIASTRLRAVAYLVAAGRDLIEAAQAALHAFNTNPQDRFLTPEEEEAIAKLRVALTKARLPQLSAEILHRGPDRVVINESGEATTSRRAREDYGILPDVIFIRNDGWSLGAPAHLERVAYEMHQGEWVGYMRTPFVVERMISEYPA